MDDAKCRTRTLPTAYSRNDPPVQQEARFEPECAVLSHGLILEHNGLDLVRRRLENRKKGKSGDAMQVA